MNLLGPKKFFFGQSVFRTREIKSKKKFSKYPDKEGQKIN